MPLINFKAVNKRKMPLRALVPIKQVIEYTVKIRVLKDNTGVDKSGVKMSINPFCEIALEEAIRLKEKKLVDEVTAVTIGSPKTQDMLRRALAMGADNAIQVTTEDAIDQKIQPIHVSHILNELVKQKNSDFVILGKQSIDDDYNQTGQMLSSLLNWPMSTFISKLERKDDSFYVEREIDGGIQCLEIPTNCVLTCDLRLNKPRYPKLPDIMKAKKKPIEVREIAEFKLDELFGVNLLNVQEPPVRKGGVMVADVDELLDKLRNEAKVL